MGKVVGLLEYRYAKIYREQLALWHSRRFGPSTCHQIAKHVCRDEILGRLRRAEMDAIDKRLRAELPAAATAPFRLEEAS